MLFNVSKSTHIALVGGEHVWGAHRGTLAPSILIAKTSKRSTLYVYVFLFGVRVCAMCGAYMGAVSCDPPCANMHMGHML